MKDYGNFFLEKNGDKYNMYCTCDETTRYTNGENEKQKIAKLNNIDPSLITYKGFF